jgi:DNA-binding XRE family transcriptional regulator
MTPAQCRAARAWLNWRQIDLAHLAEVSRDTIRLYETRDDHTLYTDTEQRIVSAFAKAGVLFTELGLQYSTEE